VSFGWPIPTPKSMEPCQHSVPIDMSKFVERTAVVKSVRRQHTSSGCTTFEAATNIKIFRTG
jgi:hypothetical protein